MEYEFGGPLGAAAITGGLPVLLYVFAFACNDLSGCPAPSLLHPSSLSWETLQRDVGWPEKGIRGLWSWHVTAVALAYYLVNLLCYAFLPAKQTLGTKLRYHSRPLTYRYNAFATTLLQLAICAAGTYVQGAHFVLWTYIADHYVQLLTANIAVAYALAVVLYLSSFTVDTNYPNRSMRELATGGNTGNVLYDFFIGRELNPRVTLPLIGEVDIKFFCGMRPGLTGWLLLNLAFVAKQYRLYGFVSDSIVLVAAVQAYYVLEGQYSETGILTMNDITNDGLGFMLCFGDLVWVPFLYSTQCRYLAVYPVHMGGTAIVAVSAVFALGLYIFRASNNQKILFRTNPTDPRVQGLSYIRTQRGTNLLTAGWWGMARHINYFGDWLQAWPFCLPTGWAGYRILPAGAAVAATKMVDGREVATPEDARGWGVVFTYFYMLYFGVLLLHRERRDDAICAAKYGEDWQKYKSVVRWRILPGVY